MGALADKLKARGDTIKGPPCHTGLMLQLLPDDLKADLVEALADKTVKATDIATDLTDLGYRVGYHSVQRHRRGSCGCAR